MRYGVVGDPVDHSRSPAMHNAGYRYLGIKAFYELLPTPPDAFSDVVSELRKGFLDGVNVTMPHKRHAFAAADVADTTAARLGAANTMVVTDGAIHVYNTDVGGVRHAFSQIGAEPGAPVYLLGSGGAAASALVALESRATISVASRNSQRAAALCEAIRVEATVVPWGDSVPGAVLVNATPLGMHGESLPDNVIQTSTGVIDMAYGTTTTPAIATATRRSIPCADGLVMLAGQAREAFRLFTGKDVPISVLERAARGT